MKSILLTCVACTVLAFGIGAAGAAAPAAKDTPAKKKDDAKSKPINAKCPLTGEDIDPKVTTVQDGKVVAFCCESCIADFKKEPAKYMKKIAADNKEAAKEKDKKGGKSDEKAKGE